MGRLMATRRRTVARTGNETSMRGPGARLCFLQFICASHLVFTFLSVSHYATAAATAATAFVMDCYRDLFIGHCVLANSLGDSGGPETAHDRAQISWPQ